MTHETALENLIGTFPSLLVGYSGGVDSALLAVVARRVLGRERSLAVIGVSASFAGNQHRQALDIAKAFDVSFAEVETDELDDPGYTSNPTNRCYFCKKTLWRHLTRIALERKIPVVADGTNADDLTDHRPGRGAAHEAGVRSPLLEAGYGKARIRDEAQALGIPVWDAPASPCLSSRVMYGLSITPDRLRQVELGEALLRSVGVRGDLRVRHRGSEARIEVVPSELPSVRDNRVEIGEGLLRLGFTRVTLDLNGYRRGSLLSSAEPGLELLAELGGARCGSS